MGGWAENCTEHLLRVSFACILLHNALLMKKKNPEKRSPNSWPVKGGVATKTQICLTPNVTCF